MKTEENYGMFVLKWHFHSLSPKSPAGGLGVEEQMEFRIENATI